MENIITPIDVIIAELGKFKGSISRILKEIADRQAEIDTIKVAQTARADGLDVREKEVKKIEDIVELKASAQRLVNQAEEGARALLRSQQAFDDFVTGQKKILAEQEDKNKRDNGNNENESKALIKARTELEEDKKTYKEKLVKELIAKAK